MRLENEKEIARVEAKVHARAFTYTHREEKRERETFARTHAWIFIGQHDTLNLQVFDAL